jgi:hypothetical protein
VQTTMSRSHWARVQRTAVATGPADRSRVVGDVMVENLYDASFNDKEYDVEYYDVDLSLSLG